MEKDALVGELHTINLMRDYRVASNWFVKLIMGGSGFVRIYRAVMTE